MLIRNLKEEDYERLYALCMSCEGMGLNNIDDTKEGIDRFLKRNPDTCFVAEDEGEFIGVILAGNDGRRGYIYHTAVLPLYRRQGIASMLVDNALKALKNLGIIKVALLVFSRNEAGNTFWEKQGFTSREDVIYRNKALTEIVRIDT